VLTSQNSLQTNYPMLVGSVKKIQSGSVFDSLLFGQRYHSAQQKKRFSRNCFFLGTSPQRSNPPYQVQVFHSVNQIFIIYLKLNFRDQKIKHRVERIFKIWEERDVYSSSFITELNLLLEKTTKVEKTQPTVKAVSDFEVSVQLSYFFKDSY
jgi:hypothetical protein